MGCEVAAQQAIYEDDEDSFFTCPFKFISPSVADFLSRYDALKDGWTRGLPYDKTLNKFLEAIRCFEGYLAKFKSDKEPQNDFSAFTTTGRGNHGRA